MKTTFFTLALATLITAASAQENKPLQKTVPDTVYYNKDGKIISQDSVKKHTPAQKKDTLKQQKNPKQNKSGAEKNTEQHRQQNKNEDMKKGNSKGPHEMRRDSLESEFDEKK